MSEYLSWSNLVPQGLPSGHEIAAQGKELGKNITIGKTLFMREHGVSSESEYKHRMVSQGKIMYHVVFGLDTWAECIEGMKYIYEELTRRNARLDRWTIIPARAMGLPPEMRSKVAKETGLMLTSPEEWLQLGQIVPIQPHLGDHVIGSPASVENLSLALAAGTTTVGNLAQYFGYDYPGWTDEVSRTVATVKALGIMAQLKDKGVVTTSNLDDGPTCLMDDRTSYIGWAMLEKYIVEDLIGAQMAHHFGNLVTDLQMRLALLLAVDEIHGRETSGAFIQGNTIYTQDMEKNVSILNSYLLFDIIGQLKNPTGHAITPVPLTEYDRIPSPAEIVQGVVMANQLAEEAHKVVDLIDLSRVVEIKDRIVTGGQLFRDKMLSGLEKMGIDITDPVQLLLALRRIGTKKMEELFGIGKEDDNAPNRRRPAIPTDMFQHTYASIEEIKREMRERNLCQRTVEGKVILLSTDVHEYAKFVIGVALREAGLEIIDLGHSIEPSIVIAELLKTKANGICISTHNGMALSYAKSLLAELASHDIEVPIFMGGRLNELTGETLPRDVTADLTELKVIPCLNIFDVLDNLT